MPLVEIPDKQMVVDFPNTMTAQEIERAIQSEIYGQKADAVSPDMPPQEAPVDSFDMGVSTDARRAERGAQEQADQMGAPISTITNKPIPTSEEKIQQSDFITSAPASAVGIIGGMGAAAGGGYVGLLRLITTGDIDKAKVVMDEINAQPAKFIKTPQQAKVVENIGKAMMYFPEKGGEALAWMGKVADAELQKMGSAPTYLEPFGKAYGEAVVLLAFPILKGRIAKSNWFRMLANEERALVVQSLDDAIRNNPKMTEGEILRKWDNPQWRKEALSKRATGEAQAEPGTAPIPPEPPPISPNITDLHKAVVKDALAETMNQTGIAPEVLMQKLSGITPLAPESSLGIPPAGTSPVIPETSEQVPKKETVMAASLDKGDTFEIDGEKHEVLGVVDGKIRIQDGVELNIDPMADLTVENLKQAPAGMPIASEDIGKQIKEVAEKNNTTFQGAWPGTDAWSLRDDVTGGNFTVKSADEISAKLAELRGRAKPATPTTTTIPKPTAGEAPKPPISRKKGKGKAVKGKQPEKKIILPDKDVSDALDLMAADIQNTKGNERGTTSAGAEAEGDTSHNIGSSNPEWFKKLNALVEFETIGKKKDGSMGTVKHNGISRDTFFNIQRKVTRWGEDSLTEIQKRYYFFIEQVIPDFKAQSQDFKAMDDLAFMEEKGYEPLGGKKIIAGDLQDGDKVIIRGEEFENKGMNADGTMTLEDGIPIKVDVFDEITIEGIKKAPAEKAETLPEGLTVNWNKVETKEKDGVTGTYYAVYNKDGSFKKWHTKTEIDRLKSLKGVEGLSLKQDSYGKQDGATGKETKGKQAGFGFVIEDPSQPTMFKESSSSYGAQKKERIEGRGRSIEPMPEKYLDKKGSPPYEYLKEDGSLEVAWQNYQNYLDSQKGLPANARENLSFEDHIDFGHYGPSFRTARAGDTGLFIQDENLPAGELPDYGSADQAPTYKQYGLFNSSGIAEKQAHYSVGDHSDKPVVMQMPELVQLFKELSNGKYPQITKIIGRSLRTQGAFNPVTGGVRLQKDIFADQAWALKVLAHEIGHWIDWMPDKNLSRGNILGRVASLKGYMEHWLDDIYGGKGRLTDADKKFYKREAKKLAGGERWIDEFIEKTFPITPDDILDIWNSGLPREALHADLLDFIMRLDTAEKKAIVVAAMKGIVPDDVKQFARVAKEYTGKKIKVKIPANDQAVMDKYKELIAAELKKRNIYNLDEIRNELKAFTQEWKPFEPDGDPAYTKYRFSGKELYADAMSGLLTNPDAFRVVAPKFYSAWFSWIHRKPEFKAVWEAWQNKIGQGSVEVTKERMQNIYDMFEKNDKARIDEMMKQREGSITSAYDGLMTYFWDKNHKALGLLRALKKEKGVNADHATETRNMIEEANYIASEISVYVGDIFEHIMNPIEAKGYDAKELGLVLFQKRVLGDRSEIGNPLGHSPETTAVDIKNIEDNIWGKEKTKALNDFAEKLRSIRESLVLPVVEQSGLATPEFMKIIQDTKAYATFSNIEWFKDKGGSGPGAALYRQIGTLSEIENPLVSMILKDISLVRAARMNITKRELSIDLFHAGVIEQAKTRWSKDANGNVPVDPSDPKKAMYSFMVQGKPEFYYVPSKIADMFKYAPVEAQQVATIWRYATQPIRELLVSKNPIWMTRNVIRDIRQTIKNIPEVTLKDIPKLLLEYKRAFNEVRKDVFGSERSATVRKMLSEKALPTNRMWSGFDETIESELDRMGIELNLSRKQNLDSPVALRALKYLWEQLDKVGRVSEIWGKTAGYKYLQKYSTRSRREIAGVVRRRVGTPDYRRIGSGQQLTNNVAMFSNVGKEGIRAAIESATEDPGNYAWKTLWMNVMPKLVISFLGSGAVLWGMSKLGYDDQDDEDIKKVKTLQRVINGVSEYDRSNYTIIPLGLTDSGKSAFLRIPEDYEGQFWGALVHKLMSGKIAGHAGSANLISEQSPYRWHPYITAISRLMTYYVKGQNPVDDYRGRNIMSDATFEAGGAYANKVMAKSTWKEVGGSLIYEPPWDGLDRDEKSYEKALKTFPLNALGTFLRFSDQGITEKIEAELQTIRKGKAIQTLVSNEAFIRLVNGDQLTPEQTIAIIEKKDHAIKAKLLTLLGKKYGDAYVRQLTRPGISNDEKIAIFNMMLKDK